MVSLLKKGFNFLKAYAKWAAAGKPLRSEEYIFDLYDNHCLPCKEFKSQKPNEGECGVCGCYIKRIAAEQDDLNKLAWPTERCPLGKWEADVDEPEDT